MGRGKTSGGRGARGGRGGGRGSGRGGGRGGRTGGGQDSTPYIAKPASSDLPDSITLPSIMKSLPKKSLLLYPNLNIHKLFSLCLNAPIQNLRVPSHSTIFAGSVYPTMIFIG